MGTELLRHQTATERLREELLDQLRQGKLKKGDRIIPLRKLSDRFGLAYASAQKVISQLEQEGYVEIRQRCGAFATGKRPKGAATMTRHILFVFDEELQTLPCSRLNHFYLDILNGAQACASQSGHSLVYRPLGRDYDLKAVDGITDLAQDGGVLLVGEVIDRGLAFLLLERGLRVVLVDTALEEIFSAVTVNISAGIGQAIKEMAKLGHCHLAFLGGPGKLPSVSLKVEALRQAVSQTLGESGTVIACLYAEPEDMFGQLKEMMGQPNSPSVLFAATDYDALSILHIVEQLGLSVPSDVSVIGFDDIEPGRQHNPALSTIGVDKADMGRLAVEMILEPSAKPVIQTVSSYYIPRDTTGPAKGLGE